MKKYLILLICVWSVGLQAQRLFQPPFMSYVGRGIEDHKFSLLGLQPYDGIGKKMLLEQYPQAWTATFNRYSTPSHPLIDAFGAIGSNTPAYDPYQLKNNKATLLMDQFRNLEANFSSSQRKRYAIFFNQFNQQIRTPTDVNQNQRLDYMPGRQFTTYNSWRYHLRHDFSVGLNSYFVNSGEWGGSTLVKKQQEGKQTLEGFVRDAQHWQLSLWANYRGFKWGQFGMSIDLNQNRQNLDWKTYTYRGKEKQAAYLLTYRRIFKNNELYAAGQYVHDKTTEKVDSLQIQPRDQYWRGIAEWQHTLSPILYFSLRLNAEKRLQQRLMWRPAAQVNLSLDKKHNFELGVFANSGQRLNKPLSLHLDRLSEGYSLRWEAGSYEVAHKIGLTFSGRLPTERFAKLILDHTWFQHKVVSHWDHAQRQLVFSNFPGQIQRDAFEMMVGGKVLSLQKLNAHLMYRWEKWTPNLQLPWQASHAAQLRVQGIFRRSELSAHYLLRGAQQILYVRPTPTSDPLSPVYHRMDLVYIQRFKHFSRDEHWSNFFSLQLQCVNVLGLHNTRETALLWPESQEPYWSDPQLRTIQLSIRQGF